MCRVGDVDRVLHFGDEIPSARVPHKCMECNGLIVPGEQYNREKFMMEGSFITWKTCLACLHPRAWLGVECGGWVYGEVISEIAEHLDENECAPNEVALLREWVVAADMRQTTALGLQTDLGGP